MARRFSPVFLLLIFGASTAAYAQLPSELLLQCDGTSKLIITGEHSDYSDGVFSKKRLRLKDGIISVDGNPALTKNCALNGGLITCESQGSQYDSTLNSTSKYHNHLFLRRATGEMGAHLETLSFRGKADHGVPASAFNVYWSGVCQAAGKPIF